MTTTHRQLKLAVRARPPPDESDKSPAHVFRRHPSHLLLVSSVRTLNQFAAFVAVARHLNFAAASRELGLAPSSVAKAVSRLEQGMHVRLFHRTTRSVRLTSDGEALYERCVDVLSQVDALEQLTAAQSSEPVGILKVSAPEAYGRAVLLPIITSLLAIHPKLQADLRMTDDKIDIVREGLDAVIRFGPLPDSDLISRQYDAQPLRLCGSPTYLARQGHPVRIDDLQRHEVLAIRGCASGADRPLKFNDDGETITMRVTSRLRTSHAPSLVDAMLLGAGLAQVPSFMVDDAIESGRLVEVLASYRPAPLAVNLVTAGPRGLSPRTAALFDALRAQAAR